MNRPSIMIKPWLFVPTLFLAWLSLPCWSGDLSADVRNGTSSPDTADGSYLELGAGFEFSNEPFYGIPQGNNEGEMEAKPSLDINLRLQYKGFFLEGFSQSLESLSLGYNITNTEYWSLDAIGLQQHAEISSSISRDLEGLTTRESDFMGGLRVTGYFDNYIVQLHGLTDLSDTHDGQVFSAKIARNWQLRNWNLHAILGTSYRSEKVANYYLSVGPKDSIPDFPEFEAHAGFINIFEAGVTYPLSEKWVLRGLYRYVNLDSEWRGSPLLVTNHLNVFKTSLSYVF